MNEAEGTTKLRTGAPMWAHPPWIGALFPDDVDPLSAYSTWCTAVEGNTTFYATPAPATIERWVEALADRPEFRFCFKLPRSITHERRLRNCADELGSFLDTMSPLLGWMGPVQIQLPATFEPTDLAVLFDFIDRVPNLDHRWAVEVRHPAFFPGGDHERQLSDGLAQRGVNRVLLDSRTLFAGPCQTGPEQEAFAAKPRLPVRPVATGVNPLVRFIGQTEAAATEAGWRQWVPKVAEWVLAGLEPYVFVHTPDNVEAPQLNRRFHHQVAALVPDLVALREPLRPDVQLDLLDH